MPPTRIISSFILRNTKSGISRTLPQRLLNTQPQRALIVPLAQPPTQRRCQSQDSTAGSGSSKGYGFDDIKALVSKPSTDRILIDAREPGELQQTGRIPTAINIPITTQPDSFFISEEEFEDRFGFERPPKDKEVVFYCRSGVRSKAAAQLARQGGWERTSEYPGSWLDWEGKGGAVERK